jgi:uncharacterized protein
MANIARLLLVLVLFFTVNKILIAEAKIGINTNTTHIKTKVIPWADIRKRTLIRQGWDISCGAAALATLMTFHHNKPVTEIAITLTLLKNTDPNQVRDRGGFSLLDLKRYVKAIGYKGSGYGNMKIKDLEDFATPAILPVRIRGFDHFVVFRSIISERILLGDPAFGNITLTFNEFDKIWRSKIAFYVTNIDQIDNMKSKLATNKPSQLTPEDMELAIPNLNYASRKIRSAPIMPITRRLLRITP